MNPASRIRPAVALAIAWCALSAPLGDPKGLAGAEEPAPRRLEWAPAPVDSRCGRTSG